MRIVHAMRLCAVALLLSCPLLIMMVFADVPSILELKRETRGSETVLLIRVRHSSPSSNHFVDTIDVEIDGKVEKITGLGPQTEISFNVEYKLGAGSVNVRARAYCIVHGWSQWASEAKDGQPSGGGIPSFPYESIIIGLVVGMLALWTLQRRR